MSKLPVKVLVRLCTDDEKVIDMYNLLDDRYDSLDVLDDYWGEAMEVYLHNPWLTYSIGVHRLREMGLAPDVLGNLDQRPLTLDEIHQLCLMLFVGDDSDIYLPLPPYQPTMRSQLRRQSWLNSWIPFIVAIEELVGKERLQWNPVRRRMMPWIDLKKLESTLKDQCMGPSLEKSNSFNAAIDSIPEDESAPRRTSEPDKPSGPMRPRSRQMPRRWASDIGQDPPASENPQFNKPKLKRIQSTRPTAVGNSGAKNLTLEETIRRWSHSPPDYKRPRSLQKLLVSVPHIFPPFNDKVESHDYFSKWKKFDKEGFSDMSEDELNPLLQRAMRKAKFFLHPDKLPKDLTENQTILFKTIWDVITLQESVVFG